MPTWLVKDFWLSLGKHCHAKHLLGEEQEMTWGTWYQLGRETLVSWVTSFTLGTFVLKECCDNSSGNYTNGFILQVH